MAKTALDLSDVSILRGNQSVKDIRVNITPLTIVQSGTITAVPTTDPYVSLSWSGSTTGIVVGQMVKITNGTTLRTWGVIRKAPVSTTLYINEVPLGSPGYTTEIESPIQVGDTVSVMSHHPLWGLHSRINNRVFYQTWDIPYGSDNEDIPPVANAGQWQSAKVAVGSTASFTLPRFGTNTSFAMSGTLSGTPLWTLPTGVTLQAGYTVNDTVIEVDAEPGYHLVSYKVIDSNTKNHTAYTWLFVSDGTDGTTLDERYQISNLSIQQTQKGFTGSFTITGTSLEDVLYPGAGILINETPHFANGTLTDGVFVDCFVGYLADVDYSYSADRISTATVSFESPIIYANRIVQPEQSLTEVANAANWTQCSSAMSNPRGAFYFAWKHKTPALGDMHDIDANSLTTPRRKTIEYNSKTLGQAIDVAAKLFLVNIGSAADGTTVIRNYPQYMNNTDRNNLAVRMTWTAQDFSLQGGLRYKKNMLSKIAQSTTGAFAYNGSTTKAWLGGKKWNQGSSTSELPNFTVPMTGGLARVLEVAGHYHAEQNREITEIPFTLIGNQDVIDPAYMIWDRLTISATYDPRGTGWSNARMLATRVDRTWNKTAQGYEKTVNIAFQPETFGQPGKEIPIGNVKTSATNVTSIPFTPQVNEALGAVGVMLAVNTIGDFAVTYDYLSDSPQWVDLSDRFEGNICDFDWDYNSAFFTGGNAITQPLGVYVCTIENLTFRVYRINDIKSPSFVPDELTTAVIGDTSAVFNGRVVCSKANPTLVVAAFKDQTGVEFIRSTNGGSTWSSKANVGDAITDTDNDDAYIGLDIIGQVQIITAPDSSNDYGLYIATTASGSFSAVTNTERVPIPMPLAKLFSSTGAYVSTAPVGSVSGSETVTFDGGGYASYTLNAGTVTPTEQAVGNPNDCVRANGTAGSDAPRDYSVDVNLGGTVDVTSVGLDIWHLSQTLAAAFRSSSVIVTFYDGITAQDSIKITIGIDEDQMWLTMIEYDLTGSIPADPYIDDWLVSSWASGIPCDRVNFMMESFVDVATWDLRMDNMIIGYGAPGDAGILYKVTSLTGSSSWVDESPASGSAPNRPHDLVIDRIDSNDLHATAFNGTNYDYYSSVNAASSWSLEDASTDKRVPLSVGSAIAAGGNDEVVVSLNSGTSFDDKTGNLSAVWAVFGSIKRLLAL